MKRHASARGRKGKPSFSCVPAASGAAASPRRKPRRQKGRDERGLETMEETVRLMCINELDRYSSATLWALAARMECALAALPLGTIERDYALLNLGAIRRLLASREPSPH